MPNGDVNVLRTPMLAGVLAAVLAASGCGSSGDRLVEIEKKAHQGASVRDHTLIDTFYSNEVVSIYVGMRVDDPARLVTVSGGRFKKPEFPLTTEVFEDLAQADFDGDGGTRCHTNVLRLRQGREPQENWPLSTGQREGVRAGMLELLKVTTVCDGRA
jgi:hypothetical protein